MIVLMACNNARETTQLEIQSPLMSCSPAVEPNYANATVVFPTLVIENQKPENALVAMLQPAALREQNENAKLYAK